MGVANTEASSLPTVSTAWQKYQQYYVDVDPKQGDRATNFPLFSRHTFKRPQMRAFQVAWFGFFIAFTAWFSFAPLMPEVKKSLNLTKNEVFNSGIASVSATVAARMIVGPLCDSVGARYMQVAVLVLGGIATYFGGLAHNATSLCIIRFFIGILGASFVSTMYWTSAHFTREVVGLVNATAAGWGNFGGGITHLLMIAIWNMFRHAGYSDEGAWRRAFTIPASMVLVTAAMTYFLAEDCPKGNYRDLYKHGSAVRRSSIKTAQSGWGNFNSWVLFLHYALSFGMELTIINNAPLYFSGKWGVSTDKAGLISALFGCMNLWARSLGGFTSDFMSRRFGQGATGMRGRIITQFVCLLGEGLMLMLFASRDSLSQAAGILTLFSMFVAMANGSAYSIVPYVMPDSTGAVSGVVGAGGNIGAVCWSLYLRFSGRTMSDIFFSMGVIVASCSVTTLLLRIRGYDSCATKAKGEQASLDVL